jgi:hypothetical protein
MYIRLTTYSTEYRIQNTSETHVHKITNVPVFYLALELMILMVANPLLGLLEGMGPENQMALVSLYAISGPKKVLIFRAHLFQWPSKWICMHQNHYVPRHRKHRYINS